MKKLVLGTAALFTFLMSGCSTTMCASAKAGSSASASCSCEKERSSDTPRCSAYNHNGRCVAW